MDIRLKVSYESVTMGMDHPNHSTFSGCIQLVDKCFKIYNSFCIYFLETVLGIDEKTPENLKSEFSEAVAR